MDCLYGKKKVWQLSFELFKTHDKPQCIKICFNLFYSKDKGTYLTETENRLVNRSLSLLCLSRWFWMSHPCYPTSPTTQEFFLVVQKWNYTLNKELIIDFFSKIQPGSLVLLIKRWYSLKHLQLAPKWCNRIFC